MHEGAADALTWAEVARSLGAPRNVWLATVRPHGEPHAAPVWTVSVDQQLYVYSGRSTVKAHNLAADPRAVLHSESGDDVVIAQGRLLDSGHPRDHAEVTAAFEQKYTGPDDAQYLPSADPAFDVMYRFEPHKALSWSLAAYEGSQRRWSAPVDGTGGYQHEGPPAG